MNDVDRVKRWTCALCGKLYVVPELARVCEEKHLDYQDKEQILGDHLLMANNPFSSAPSGTGGIRGLSRQIAGVMAGSSFLGGKGGVNARQASALSNQQHIQNVQHTVVKHVLGQEATSHAEKTKRVEGVKKSRAEHKLTQAAADAAHQRTLADRSHAASTLQANKPEGTVFGSFSVPGASATLKTSPKVGKQFTGVGGDTSSQAATNLEQ